MDLDCFFNVPVWLLLLTAATCIIYVYGNPWQRWETLGVPGPAPTMFVGNFTQLFSHKDGLQACMKQWQAQFGRSYGIYYMREPALVITDIDTIKQVFIKDFNNFRDRWFLGGKGAFQDVVNKGLFFAGGETWRRERKLMTPIFTSGKLKQLTHHINVSGHHLLDALMDHAAQKKPVLAKDVFGAFSVDVIFRSGFALDVNSQKDIEGIWFQHVKSLITIRPRIKVVVLFIGLFPILTDVFAWLDCNFFKNSDIKFFKDQITALINDRKKNKEASYADMLQFLINSESEESDIKIGESKKLSTEEIIAQCIIFIIAGYETSSTTLQFLGYELAKRPEVQETMFNEIRTVVGDTEDPTYVHCQSLPYTEAVIYETLRYYPPLTILTRTSTNPTQLDGFNLPANQSIFIPVKVVMRDPTYFPDPDTFDPTRFIGDESQSKNLSMFLPFGLGQRHCIGMRLAMLQIKMALVHVVRKVKLVGVTPEELVIEDFANLLHAKESIKLSVETR